MEKVDEVIETKGLKSLIVNPDCTGFFLVKYVGLDDLLWESELSPFDKWGIVFDAFLFLLSGRITFKEYLEVLNKFSREASTLPAGEISDQLGLLYTLVPSKVCRNCEGISSDPARIAGAQDRREQFNLTGESGLQVGAGR